MKVIFLDSPQKNESNDLVFIPLSSKLPEKNVSSVGGVKGKMRRATRKDTCHSTGTLSSFLAFRGLLRVILEYL